MTFILYMIQSMAGLVLIYFPSLFGGISKSKKYLVTQTEVGMLPIRYARTIRSSSFIEPWLKLEIQK